MCLTTGLLVGAFISLIDSNLLNVVERGCEIYISWSSQRYEEVDIYIRKENDSDFQFNLQTSDVNFIYRPSDPSVKYLLIWYPITRENKTRHRVENLKLNKTAMLEDCLSPGSTYSPDPTTPCISDFCRIYFWTSIVVIPLLIIVTTSIFVYLYLFKDNGLKRTHNAPNARSNLNVNSMCYNNNGVNEYDQVRYSLMQDTRL